MKEKDDSSFNKSNADHSAFNASLLSKNYLLARRSEKESLDSLDMKAIKKTKKIKRYIIGFIFFIFYISLNVIELLISIFTKYNYDLNPLSEVYLRLSSLLIFIFISMCIPRFSKNKYFQVVNIMRNYIPDWKKQNELRNKSSFFYVFEGTEEKFNKLVHKISYSLMWMIFFALVFEFNSFKNSINVDNQLYVSNISFPLFSLLIIVILRKYFLHTAKFTLLAKLSAILIIIGIIFLFFFQYKIYSKDEFNSEIYIPYFYSALGGIFFGFYSTFLKYHSNVYGNNFKISAVLGYIGIFTLTSIPFIISLYILLLDENENIELFSFGNDFNVWLTIFIINFLKFLCSIHCIIGLSPLVFSMGLFFNILVNLFVEILFTKELNFDYLYFTSLIFVLLGIIIGIIDKYLKSKYTNAIINQSESKKL